MVLVLFAKMRTKLGLYGMNFLNTNWSTIEQLEARLSYLKEDSKMCTHRVKYFEDKRKWVQQEIKKTKKEIKELSKLK